MSIFLLSGAYASTTITTNVNTNYVDYYSIKIHGHRFAKTADGIMHLTYTTRAGVSTRYVWYAQSTDTTGTSWNIALVAENNLPLYSPTLASTGNIVYLAYSKRGGLSYANSTDIHMHRISKPGASYTLEPTVACVQRVLESNGYAGKYSGSVHDSFYIDMLIGKNDRIHLAWLHTTSIGNYLVSYARGSHGAGWANSWNYVDDASFESGGFNYVPYLTLNGEDSLYLTYEKTTENVLPYTSSIVKIWRKPTGLTTWAQVVTFNVGLGNKNCKLTFDGANNAHLAYVYQPTAGSDMTLRYHRFDKDLTSAASTIDITSVPEIYSPVVSITNANYPVIHFSRTSLDTLRHDIFQTWQQTSGAFITPEEVSSENTVYGEYPSAIDNCIAGDFTQLIWRDPQNDTLLFQAVGLIVSATVTSATSGSDALYTYPNPFQPFSDEHVHIVFNMQQAGWTRINVYSMAGDQVWSYDHYASAGANEVVWDGRNVFGDFISNGVYLIRVLNENKKPIKKGRMAVID
ncbi:MAG: hypothetical protein KKA19_03800 [Candidatus Margulisbacteria bacterium]|nr:hypothetical protein [Candidatus Margulisiibacteriota bacterium]